MTSFVGQYVDELKAVLIASALSAQNMLVISPPGTGKTVMMKDGAQRMFGDRTAFFQLDASTPPEPIKGAPDPAALLASPPEYKIVVTGTAFDPLLKMFILDELGRPNDAVFDGLLHAMNRNDEEGPEGPVFWGTSNFPIPGARAEAVRDRIPIVMWLDTGRLNVRGIVQAVLGVLGKDEKLTIGDSLPTYDEIMQVRHMIPGKNAAECIADLLERLCDEITAQNIPEFVPNPRRITQWSTILFRAGAYYSKSDNFGILPVEASSILRYAQVTTSRAQWVSWKKIADAVSDPIGVSLERHAKAAFQRLKEVREQSSGSKTDMAMKLAKEMAHSEEELNSLGKKDPRVAEYVNRLRNAFAEIVRGNNPDGL